MKKYTLCFLVTFCMLFSGCSSPKLVSLSLGKYQLENTTGITAPYVLLKENNEFIFIYSNLSSYLNHGTYKAKDNTLTLTTEDDTYTYVFQVLDGNLYFNMKLSSEITTYKGESSIKDGAKFVLIKDE